jgi:glycosyltransferase involved in cell wall biosynthesis
MKVAGELGVADDLSLPGWTTNLFAYMARAAGFVLSSRSEGFGNVLAEAMACGCPVVSTDCPGGPREILDGGRFGRLVPVADDLALARAIRDTLECPPEKHLLRERAACFSVHAQSKSYLDLLASVQKDRPCS